MEPLITAALNIVSAVIGGLVTWLLGRRKARADAEGAIARAAKQIVEAATAQVTATERRMAARMREHEDAMRDMQNELRIVRARLRELELSHSSTLASIMAVATSASEQVAKLTVLRESEREQLVREISRLRALAGMQMFESAPNERVEYERRQRARDRFNGGS